MPTNLALDDNLLEEALKVGGLKTKKDTVNAALKEFVERRKQQEIIALFGSLPADDDYDYDYKRGRSWNRYLSTPVSGLWRYVANNPETLKSLPNW